MEERIDVRELEGLRERVAALEAALKECADDLRSELDARYKFMPDGTIHPAMHHKYDRDMEPVDRAAALLSQAQNVKESGE